MRDREQGFEEFEGEKDNDSIEYEGVSSFVLALLTHLLTE